MNTKIVTLLAGLSILLISSCNGPNNKNGESEKQTPVSLRQDWSAYAGYAGELFAASKTDSANGIDLKVETGSESVSPVKMVLSGENTFGVTGASTVIAANEKGADLVIIGVLNYKSPVCFLSLNKKITEPANFAGKKVGINNGGASELVYKTLLAKLNINKDSFTEVPISFDLASFIAGVYDVRPAFIYSEPIILDAKKIKYTVIRPEKYGVNFLGQVYFTKRVTVEKKPEIVQAFINSIAEGWQLAIKSPKEGIALVKKFDSNIDEANELASLTKDLSYFGGENGKILYVSDAKWKDMLVNLAALKVIKSADDKNGVLDLSFVNNYTAK